MGFNVHEQEERGSWYEIWREWHSSFSPKWHWIWDYDRKSEDHIVWLSLFKEIFGGETMDLIKLGRRYPWHNRSYQFSIIFFTLWNGFWFSLWLTENQFLPSAISSGSISKTEFIFNNCSSWYGTFSKKKWSDMISSFPDL